MRGLSSIINSRWISRSASVAMATLRGDERQRQRKGRALTNAAAFRVQGAADLPGGERTAVQAKTVAFSARGEAVIEDAFQVFRRNADAGIVHRDEDGGGGCAYAHRHAFLAPCHLGA